MRLRRSLIATLRYSDLDASRGLVAPLLENFRMNDRLCQYPSESLYPTDYRPVNDDVAARRLQHPPLGRGSSLGYRRSFAHVSISPRSQRRHLP
jgi:hypothetical protein